VKRSPKGKGASLTTKLHRKKGLYGRGKQYSQKKITPSRTGKKRSDGVHAGGHIGKRAAREREVVSYGKKASGRRTPHPSAKKFPRSP